MRGSNPENLSGRQFGHWTVIEHSAFTNRFWLCRCDCGVEREVNGGNLRSGVSQSCGHDRAQKGGRATTGRLHRDTEIRGQRFGKWTALEKRGGKHWLCRCDCGNEVVVYTSNLRGGRSTSCGCERRKKFYATITKHGLNDHPLHSVWRGIKDRCFNPNNQDFHHYDGRGIRMCDRWKDDFTAFWDDMASGWRPGLTIERINVDGNYELSNCHLDTALRTMEKPKAATSMAIYAGKSRAEVVIKARDFHWLWSYDRIADSVRAIGYRGTLGKVANDILIPKDSDLVKELNAKHADEIKAYLDAPYPSLAPCHPISMVQFNANGNKR